MTRTRILLLASGMGMALLLAMGCSRKDPAELVRQRATERWDLLAGRHAVKAYDYLSPGYRSTHTLEQYVSFVATARVQWKSAKVDSIQCDADSCTAKLTVLTVLPGALMQRPSDMEYPAPVVEQWVRSDGEWYFLPDAKIEAKSIAEQAASQAAAQTPAPAAEVPAAEAPKAAPPAAAEAGSKDDRK
ncbi:MAG: hypothetical protein JSS59_04845 [Proteobacteria bacterium]|nr:hypothetical protein [Pseudomonadota bacterium]